MLKLTKLFILAAAVLNAAGWVLSCFQRLNATGYLVVLGLTAALAWAWWRHEASAGRSALRRGSPLRRWWRRFRRPLPLLFLGLALAALAGGALYPPNNADSLLYRFPRMLQYLAAEQWHWIHARDIRQNIVAPGMEWLSMPLLVLTKSDRLFFWINLLCYALMPGLVFSVFTRLGVRPRVAWHWMWLAPAGWCYALQAGSVANDSFAVVFALAAVDLSFRGREKWRLGDLLLGVLAAALLTNTKQTNIPLLLPWLIVLAPTWRLLLGRPFLTFGVCALALLASILPQTVANLEYAGTWVGFPTTRNYQPESALAGVVGNAFALAAQNLMPPLFPWAGRWNDLMAQFLQTPLGTHFASFEAFGHLNRAVTEQATGLGLIPCLFVFATFVAARRNAAGLRPPSFSLERRLLLWLPWLLLLLFMAKVGVHQNARYLAAYYPLLLPALLVAPAHTRLVRQRWWRAVAVLVMLSTLGLVVLSRHRPLWPAQSVLSALQTRFPHSGFLRQMRNSYGFMNEVQTNGESIRSLLPAGEGVIGYAAYELPEAALWKPYGGRRLEHVLDTETRADLRRRGLRYVVVNDRAVQHAGEPGLDEWLRRRGLAVVKSVTTRSEPEAPLERVYLTAVLP